MMRIFRFIFFVPRWDGMGWDGMMMVSFSQFLEKT